MIIKNTEKKEKSIVTVDVGVDAAEFEKAIDAAYKKSRSSIVVPGFRKGKAPRKIIENMYGTSIFYDDAVQEIFPEAYSYAIEQENLKIVGRPTIDNLDVADDKSLTITFSTAVYPEVKITDYLGQSAVYKVAAVEEADVDAAVEEERKKNVRILSVERPAQNGDTTIIDFEGFVDGVAFDGGKGERYPLTLGSGQFIPGFEEALIGVSAGEDKEVKVTFPEEYAENLAGKDATFKVHVHEVKENQLPDLDDEFAKDISEFDTLEEYREDIRKNLAKTKEEAAQRVFNESIMDKVIENLEADIPDAMVEERLDNMIDEYSYNLSSQGMTLDQYLGYVGLTMEQFRDGGRFTALRRVQEELVLAKVAELENIEITDEDIDAEYENLAEVYNMEVDRVKTMVQKEYLKEDLLMRRAGDIIYNSAVKLDKEEEEEGEAEAAEEAAPEQEAEEK